MTLRTIYASLVAHAHLVCLPLSLSLSFSFSRFALHESDRSTADHPTSSCHVTIPAYFLLIADTKVADTIYHQHDHSVSQSFSLSFFLSFSLSLSLRPRPSLHVVVIARERTGWRLFTNECCVFDFGYVHNAVQ